MRLTLSLYFSPNNMGSEQLEFETILQVLFSIFPTETVSPLQNLHKAGLMDISND